MFEDEDDVPPFGDIPDRELTPEQRAEKSRAAEVAHRAAQASREAPLVTISLDTPVGYSGGSYDPEGPEPAPDVTILDLIVERAARQLITEAEGGEGSRYGYGGGHLSRHLRDVVQAEVQAQAAERAAAIVEEALTQPFRKTNHMGEPTGPETTLRAMIVDDATQMLRGKLEYRDSRGDRKTLAAADIVRTAVGTTLERELADAIKQATKAAKDAVTTQATTLIAKAIQDGLRFS